jgi:hypothetical protein
MFESWDHCMFVHIVYCCVTGNVNLSYSKMDRAMAYLIGFLSALISMGQ